MLSPLIATLTDLGRRLKGDERGASLVEYALLVALIAIACFVAITFVGTGTNDGLTRSNDCMEAAYDGNPLPADCPD